MKAIIFYNRVASAAKAIAILRRASSFAEVRVPWDMRPWRVGVLRLSRAADEALMEGVDAELIVFADLRDSRMPIWLKDWLECWCVRRQSGESALVVTGGSSDVKPSRVTRELLSFATHNSLDLIVQAGRPIKMDSLC